MKLTLSSVGNNDKTNAVAVTLIEQAFREKRSLRESELMLLQNEADTDTHLRAALEVLKQDIVLRSHREAVRHSILKFPLQLLNVLESDGSPFAQYIGSSIRTKLQERGILPSHDERYQKEKWFSHLRNPALYPGLIFYIEEIVRWLDAQKSPAQMEEFR